jgi:Terminase large subunit, T4likevirus-type, N-terminal
LLLCSRQAGKSTTAAGLALGEALLTPKATVLLLSPSERQSGELFRKARDLYHGLGRPIPAIRQTALQLELANGSRLVALPGKEGTVRGFSEVRLLVIDEAARVMDSLYYSVRPMLAVSQGRLVALSTPFGQRGWFHVEWTGPGAWARVRVTADQVPRITKEFLAEERRALGDRWFRQEYECSFESTVDAVFDYADIQAALSADVKPLFGPGGVA